MSINRRELYEALERFEFRINPAAFLRALGEGKTTAQITGEAKKELQATLSRMPRFKDLISVYTDWEGRQLGQVRDIASHVFRMLGEPVPSNEILRELFIPGKLYDDEIWVYENSDVDNDAILLPPVLIGKNSHVASDAVIGPYSCIGKRYHNVEIGEGAYLIKSIVGEFE